MNSKLIAIGYWYSLYEPDLPDPANFEDPDWDNEEKVLVLAHLRTGKIVSEWMGVSWCRYRCGEKDMGSRCLSDGTYIYPEKLSHYIEKHNIRLPEEFMVVLQM